jgi:hypothetical protein
VFAYAGIQFLHRIEVPTDLPIVIDVQLDHRVLLFSLFAALLSALFFGLVPALQSVRTDLVPALRAADRGTTARGRTIEPLAKLREPKYGGGMKIREERKGWKKDQTKRGEDVSRGLNCGNLLSPNKQTSEPTPYGS